MVEGFRPGDPKIYFKQDEPPAQNDMHSIDAGERQENEEAFGILEDWLNKSSEVFDPIIIEKVLGSIVAFSDSLSKIQMAIESKQFDGVDEEVSNLDEAGKEILSVASQLRHPISELSSEIKQLALAEKMKGNLFKSLVDRVLNDSEGALLHYNNELGNLVRLKNLAQVDWSDYDEELGDGQVNQVISAMTVLKDFANNSSTFLYNAESFFQNMRLLVKSKDEIATESGAAYGGKAHRHSNFYMAIRKMNESELAQTDRMDEAKKSQDGWEIKYNALEDKGVLNWAKI